MSIKPHIKKKLVENARSVSVLSREMENCKEIHKAIINNIKESTKNLDYLSFLDRRLFIGINEIECDIKNDLERLRLNKEEYNFLELEYYRLKALFDV